MGETQVRPLGGEDSLEKGMATRSSILAQRIPRTEEHGRLRCMTGYSPWGGKQLDRTERLIHCLNVVNRYRFPVTKSVSHVHVMYIYIYRHTSLYCAFFYCSLQTLCFLRIEVFGNNELRKSADAIFQKAFPHSVSLCHILVILIFRIFSLLLVM